MIDPALQSQPQVLMGVQVASAAALSTAAPITTSADSTSSLPPRGYSTDQLAAYIERPLGAPTWTIELPKQSIVDAINDALGRYSIYRPRIRYGAVPLQRGQFEYLRDADMGQGPVMVEFVQPNPVPVELFWGNLIDPVPLLRNGLDELDCFMRWQKTWMRVTSVRPDWIWDDSRKTLYIWNPLDRYHCAVTYYDNYRTTASLDAFGALWVKDYAWQKARLQYAELMSKFSGAIPGPITNMQLDAGKRDLALKEIEKLEAQLIGAQVSTPIMID